MFWLYGITLAAGAANPFQSGANAALNKQLNNPLWAGLFVYTIGLVGLMVLQLAFGRAFPSLATLRSVSWWAWCGGALSIGSTMAGLLLAQKLGAGTFTGLTITAGVVTSILLDQFGLVGFHQHAASLPRVAGCALMIGGVWLVARY